jgi:hypothetical protein
MENKSFNPSLTKLRHHTKAILKTLAFIYGDLHYIINSFCKNILKNSSPGCELHFLCFSNYCQYIFIAHDVQTNTQHCAHNYALTYSFSKLPACRIISAAPHQK